MRVSSLMSLAVVAVLLVSGCAATNNAIGGASEAAARCQNKCIQLASTKMDFSKGPCLDNNITQDWVCDMAHSPREAADNEPANQCPSFGKTARHFVEVNENCRIITVV